MSYRRQTIETYDKLAEQYEQRYMDMTIYDESYDLFCELVRESGEIFEIGTGPGNIARYLLNKRPDFKLFGIDAAPAMVERAKKNNPEADFEVMDCTQIGGIEKSFDGIISGFVLPYLTKEEVAVLINDCSSLLKEKGILYLSFVNGEYESSKIQTSSDGKHSVFFHFHPVGEVIAELHRAGFELKHNLEVPFERPTGIEIHNVLIAVKKTQDS